MIYRDTPPQNIVTHVNQGALISHWGSLCMSFDWSGIEEQWLPDKSWRKMHTDVGIYYCKSFFFTILSISTEEETLWDEHHCISGWWQPEFSKHKGCSNLCPGTNFKGTTSQAAFKSFWRKCGNAERTIPHMTRRQCSLLLFIALEDYLHHQENN